MHYSEPFYKDVLTW